MHRAKRHDSEIKTEDEGKMKKEFYRELPEGYKIDKIIDAKSAKFGIIMSVVAIVLMAGVYIITDFIAAGRLTIAEAFAFENYFSDFFIPLLIFCFSSFAYIVLHELTHGAAYKLLTHEKLTFGLTWSAAYCGVPQLYLGKNIALIALLSPFVLFSIVFIVGIAIAGNGIAGLILKLLFAEHFGGCSGDLYDTVLLVFKYRKGCLVNDDGPKQTIYIKEEL